MITGYWHDALFIALVILTVVSGLSMIVSWIMAETPTVFAGVVRSIILTVVLSFVLILGVPALIILSK
jgi:hypothetical protein